MKAGSALALTIAVVALGRWARGEKLDMRVILGLAFIALTIAVLQEGNPKFAGNMAALILVGAVAVYGPDLFDKYNAPAKKAGSASKNERTIV